MENKIASTLYYIALFFYIGGFFAGIIIGVSLNDTLGEIAKGLPVITTIAFWVTYFVIGTVFLGFAEVINLLQGSLNLNVRNNSSIDKLTNLFKQNNDFLQKLINLGGNNPVRTQSGVSRNSDEQYQDLPSL